MTISENTILQRTSFFAGAMLLCYSALTVWSNSFGAMQHYTLFTTAILAYSALRLISRAPERGTDLGIWTDRVAGVAVMLGGVSAGGYFFLNAETLEITQPFVSQTALNMGLVMIVAVLLAAWRIWGTAIALICLTMAAYMLFGRMLPDVMQARMQPFNVSVSFLSGIGGPRGILAYAPLSADMIFLLLIYGGVLHAVGVIEIFGEIGALIGNRLRGGMAYSAVLASTFIGMVTGQAVSNIALSGVMTIPAMKKSRFSGEEAAAVEIMSSTGSQLLPPIMGLGAFMMAVILGVSYLDIVMAGLIPGLLYMFAIVVSLYAMIGGHKGLQDLRQEVDLTRILWVFPAFVGSFAVVITLLVLRFSPSMAGFWGSVIAAGLAFVRPDALRPALNNIRDGLRAGFDTAAQLTIILAAIGLVVQTLTSTGLGVSAGALISDLGAGNIVVTLLIGMVVCMLVGMGLPTPAAYALIAIIVVPSLIDAGISPLTANMFGFYFAIFSALTPPVAVGVLVGARIAEAGFLSTALAAARLGAMALLLPFLFVAFPSLLAPTALTLQGWVAILCFLGATILGAGALYGALSHPLETTTRRVFGIAGPGALVAYAATGWTLLGVLPAVVLIAWVVRGIRRRTPASVA